MGLGQGAPHDHLRRSIAEGSLRLLSEVAERRQSRGSRLFRALFRSVRDLK
jgi:hypothetical protein